MGLNYKKLSKEFIESGLTQVDYGKQVGISASMVSYYLKKAKKEMESLPTEKFSEITIVKPSPLHEVIKITPSKGIIIELPI